jgi:hypothetical protein
VLKKHPVVVQAISTGGLFLLGDVIAQKFVERSEGYDIKRTARLTFFGTCIAVSVNMSGVGDNHGTDQLR